MPGRRNAYPTEVPKHDPQKGANSEVSDLRAPMGIKVVMEDEALRSQSKVFPHLEWVCDDIEIYRLHSSDSMVDKYPSG